MIYDVHAHMDFFNKEELKSILDNSKEVVLIISNSVNIKSCEKNLELSKKYAKIKLATGLYPEDTLKKSDFGKLKDFVKNNRPNIIAIGEVGLDKTEKADFELQKNIFIQELGLANRFNLPSIIHTRKAEKEIIDILENYKNQKIILHCFSGNFKLIKRAIELGCYFSIPSIIVRSEHFQRLVVEVPRDKILTETDSPLLSPYKDKSNQPAYISETIRKLAEIWKISEKEVENQIEKNTKYVFSIK
jgi:TatD DNase family protein